MLKLVFISGRIRARTPYQVAENVRHAKEEAIRLMRQGWAVFCPHLNTLDMGGCLHKNARKDFEKWMEFDLEILSRCDAIYMLKGWKQSEGSRMEYKKAKELELEVIYETQ